VNGKGQRVIGNWTALIERDDWENLHSIVGARRATRKAEGRNGGYERRRYVLAGLVHCGRCNGAPVMDGTRKKKPGGSVAFVYRCKRCGAAISMAVADRVALDSVAERLVAEAGLAEALAVDDDADRRDELHRTIEAVEVMRAEASQDRADGLIDRDEYRDHLRRLGERRDALRAELAELIAPPAPDPDAARLALEQARQAHADGDAEAAAALRTLAHEWLDRVVVGPHVRGVDPEARLTIS
jgi:hypothetical protein